MVKTQTQTVTLMPARAERITYSINELAERLGVSPNLIRLEISRGRLGILRAGRRVLISPEAIDAWLKTGTKRGSKREPPAAA